MTNGEGVMCHFTGPGKVYVQTHKKLSELNTARKGNNWQAGPVAMCILLLILLVFLVFFGSMLIYLNQSPWKDRSSIVIDRPRECTVG